MNVRGTVLVILALTPALYLTFSFVLRFYGMLTDTVPEFIIEGYTEILVVVVMIVGNAINGPPDG